MENRITVVVLTEMKSLGVEIEKHLKQALKPAEKAGEEVGKKFVQGFSKQTVVFTKAGQDMANRFSQATGPIDRVIANFKSGFADRVPAKSGP